MEKTRDAAGEDEKDYNDDDDEGDVQVTVNVDSISTQMTPQFPARGAALVNIKVAKRTPGVTSTTANRREKKEKKKHTRLLSLQVQLEVQLPVFVLLM